MGEEFIPAGATRQVKKQAGNGTLVPLGTNPSSWGASQDFDNLLSLTPRFNGFAQQSRDEGPSARTRKTVGAASPLMTDSL